MSISITINQAAPVDDGAAVEPDGVDQLAVTDEPIDAGGPPAWLLAAVAEAPPAAAAETHDAGPAPVSTAPHPREC
ncbi:hypothetical protein C8046_13455 [Serinibacter arcticus]|uniref:Uncharacterized protein n=1 Tax=Serinibacter arcticus TaxID=1655435 RepID=A0A2U1ZX24_9MICO|nr:hypothetical protein [Serinibacter arcticus]PWD51514.1 hypothetical protein C8046_13455 [Serinibacter arcticus]